MPHDYIAIAVGDIDEGGTQFTVFPAADDTDAVKVAGRHFDAQHFELLHVWRLAEDSNQTTARSEHRPTWMLSHDK